MIISIDGRTIGEGQPPYVVAEAGVNHDGRVEVALELVEAAVEAGADAVKFQTFRADELVTRDAPRAPYQRDNSGDAGSQRELLERLELGVDEFQCIRRRCRELGVTFLSSPHTERAVAELAPLVPAFKIGSGDLTNPLLLRAAGACGKPVLIGTGMATLEEVRRALGWLREAGAPAVLPLHCTTSYPCPPEEVNLAALPRLAAALGQPVGFSDHTLGHQATVMAVTLGAVLVEKHFTLDRDRPGPDHAASAEPRELAELVQAVRAVPVMRGVPDKAPTPRERDILPTVRKSLALRVDLPAGSVIERAHLTALRPATGVPAEELDEVLGRRLRVAGRAGELLRREDLA